MEKLVKQKIQLNRKKLKQKSQLNEENWSNGKIG